MKMMLQRCPSQNTHAKTVLYTATWEEAFKGNTIMGNVESRAKAKALPELKKPKWCSEGTRGSHPKRMESHPQLSGSGVLSPQRAGPQGREPQPDPPRRAAEQAGVASFPTFPSLSAPGTVLRLFQCLVRGDSTIWSMGFFFLFPGEVCAF